MKLFAGLVESDATLLRAAGVVQQIAAQTFAVREGERGDSVYVIDDGHAAIVKSAQGGRYEVLAIASPGECIGEMGLVSAQPRSASVLALEPLTVWQLTSDAFANVCAAHPHIGVQIYRTFAVTLANRLRAVSDRLAALLHGEGDATHPDHALSTHATILQGVADVLTQSGQTDAKRGQLLAAMSAQAQQLLTLLHTAQSDVSNTGAM